MYSQNKEVATRLFGNADNKRSETLLFNSGTSVFGCALFDYMKTVKHIVWKNKEQE